MQAPSVLLSQLFCESETISKSNLKDKRKVPKDLMGKDDNRPREKENSPKHRNCVFKKKGREEEPSGNVRTKDMDTWVLGTRNPDLIAMRQDAGS